MIIPLLWLQWNPPRAVAALAARFSCAYLYHTLQRLR
jgi:hypothetical protein